MNVAIQKAIDIANLIIDVNATRATTDPFRVPPELLALLIVEKDDLIAKKNAVSLASGTRAGASGIYRAALTALKEQHRLGFQWLKGLPSDSFPLQPGETGPHISESQRLGLMVSYGFEGGKLGDLTNNRAISLAELTPTASAQEMENPLWAYPATLQAAIAAQLALANDNKTVADTGAREVAIKARDESLELLQIYNARVRFHYCASSNDTDNTPELSRIGYQPRRAAGEVAHAPQAPGNIVLNKELKLLAAEMMPKYATSVHAVLQAADGAPFEAGFSETTTVSLEMNAPLLPDTTYSGWLFGRNAQGDGPISETVEFTSAPQAPG